MPLLLAYRCGMRLGEIFGLMWDDIDFDNGILSINRQVQNHDDKWYLENPKYDSFRTIEPVSYTHLVICLSRELNSLSIAANRGYYKT